MIKFEVLGECKAKGRPRFKNVGKFVQPYTDEKTVNYENLVKLSFMQSGCKKIIGDVPLKIELKFYMSIPKSMSKKQRLLIKEEKLRPLKKIDLDNGIKIILDALNKVAYDDDKQVVSLNAEKYYSEEPRVEVKICQMEYH